MTTLRARSRDEQSQRILDAAFALLSERGFEEVTMTDVAEAAKVARATVFNHFRSKQGLVDAITEQVFLAYRDMLDAALAREDVPTPVLVCALFDLMATGIERTRRFQRGIFREIARLLLGFEEGGPAQRANDENHARVVKLLARGQERGEIRGSERPERMASALGALSNGTITEWLYDDDGDSLRERKRAASEIFLSGCATDVVATRDVPLPDLSSPRPWRFAP